MSAANLALMEARNVEIKLRVDGTPGLGVTASDIAGALGFITSDFPSLLLRAKYLLDEEAGRIFIRRLKGHILVTAAASDWDLPAELNTIATVLFREFSSPTRCLYCNGNTGLIIDKRWTKCIACNETGIHRWSDRTMADCLNITIPAWRQFERHYVRLRHTLGAWETEGLMFVKGVKQ